LSKRIQKQPELGRGRLLLQGGVQRRSRSEAPRNSKRGQYLRRRKERIVVQKREERTELAETGYAAKLSKTSQHCVKKSSVKDGLRKVGEPSKIERGKRKKRSSSTTGPKRTSNRIREHLGRKTSPLPWKPASSTKKPRNSGKFKKKEDGQWGQRHLTCLHSKKSLGDPARGGHWESATAKAEAES